MEGNKLVFLRKYTLAIFILFNVINVSFSQTDDSTKVPGHFGGTVTVTTKRNFNNTQSDIRETSGYF